MEDISSNVTYRSEEALVDDFIQHLELAKSPWGEVRHRREFDFQRGRTDIVAILGDGTVLAFEAKLTRWRDAVHQAYRNLCFAHRSYVVLPERAALRAAKHEDVFAERRVGLCYVDRDVLVILREASDNEPLQPWLSSRACLHVSGNE